MTSKGSIDMLMILPAGLRFGGSFDAFAHMHGASAENEGLSYLS